MYTIRKELESGLHQTSPKTREELAGMLEDLNAAMPLLIAQNPDSVDFMPLFADRADDIAHQASAADHAWLMSHVDAMLEKHGKQDDEYLLPHNLPSP